MNLRFKRLPATYLIVVLFILTLFIFTFISFARHYLLQSGIYDLGLFNQWAYLVSIGEEWEPSSLTNFFKPALGDHFALLLYPFAWLQTIFPSSYSLIFWQALGLSLLLLIFNLQLPWQSCRQRNISLLIAIIFINNPYILNSALNDFHTEVAAAFLGLCSLSLARKGKTFFSLITLILFLASKEAMIVFGLGYSIYTFCIKRRLLSIASLILSVSYFAIANHYVSPYLNYANARYGQLGSSFGDVVTSPLTKPFVFWSTLFSTETFLYVIPLLFPLILILNRSAFPAIIASIPIFVANALSSSHVMRDPIYQYQIPIIIFLLQAVLDSVNADKAYKSILNYKSKILLFALTALLSALFIVQVPAYFTRYLRLSEYSAELLAAEFRLASPDLKIWAHPGIASHFSRRKMLLTSTDDLKEGFFDYIVFPASSPLRKPHRNLTKLRNLIFGYGEADEFTESPSIRDKVVSLGYTCDISSEAKIVICKD